MEKAESDPENAGLSNEMENPINTQGLLNMCGDTDLPGAGCGSSARPVLPVLILQPYFLFSTEKPLTEELNSCDFSES
ncbi:hypothetical protein [Photorhabdus temperata]|uniref:hypothetical protein n=1 Tax=Photorhabdus temperata TaxID=574560 RepID=UPI000389E992|nr:hypothetical protein [Photorhabdus temperata]EQB97957.1 hypothetical protein B738_27887 [Photorhabdus temperata subsp. temperata M1021]